MAFVLENNPVLLLHTIVSYYTFCTIKKLVLQLGVVDNLSYAEKSAKFTSFKNYENNSRIVKIMTKNTVAPGRLGHGEGQCLAFNKMFFV